MARRRQKKRPEAVQLFAERLRGLRQSRGMTQADLAASADVSPTHLSELENAAMAPGIDLVGRLAEALGVSIADLFEAAEGPDPLPVLKEQASRMFKTLMEKGDCDAFLKLNPILALIVESATKRQ
jgi:transcriptional regulator with XRE-family HTH domain